MNQINTTKLGSLFGLVLFFSLVISCASKSESQNDNKDTIARQDIQNSKPPKGNWIIQSAIEAHGGDLYEKAHYKFVFRNKEYQFKNNQEQYLYIVKGVDKSGTPYIDSLSNDGLIHRENGELKKLPKKMANAHSNALNSVIYFATLPHKLKDKSVHKTYIGEDRIKDKKYDIVKITFSQEGGGGDFEDEYLYWINKETQNMDYLAYNYKVNKGGVRFRAAYNKRTVDGIIFQDYINYSAPVGTPLEQLSELYTTNALNELSRIETKNIENINQINYN